MKLNRLFACTAAAALAAAPLQAQPAPTSAQVDRAMATLTESNNAIGGDAIYAAVLFIAFAVGALVLDSNGEQTSP